MSKEFRYVVLGAGRQGVAAAYDLLLHGAAASVLLADQSDPVLAGAAKRLKRLVSDKSKLAVRKLDAGSAADLAKTIRGADAVLCALPYRCNPEVAKAAVAEKVSFCDLGGHLDTTKKVLKLDAAARKAGVTLVPDCGLAPGLANALAVCGMSTLSICTEVRIFCGGLPQNRNLPLGYKLVYNFQGLIGIYTEKAQLLRQGRVVTVEPLSGREEVEFPEPLGPLEAFVTAGGAATCPTTFAGRLKTYEYKTLRYPGHLTQFKTLFDIGFLDAEPLQINGSKIAPLRLAETLLQKKLDKPNERDLVVLRVVCRGQHRGRATDLIYDLVDHEDPHTGFSAMERTTGFSAAVVAWMLASGRINAKGALPPEKCVPGPEFLKQVRARGLKVRETFRS